jgi:hypothetical protein
MASHEPVLGPPPVLMTLEGLNYLVAALLVVGNKRLGDDFGREVLTMAQQLQAERQVVIAFHED